MAMRSESRGTLVDGGTSLSAIEYQLALGRLARRDYAGALEHTQRSLADGAIDVNDLSLLLYALAKNGHMEEAKAVIASVDTSSTPQLHSFLDWYEVKFALRKPDLRAIRADEQPCVQSSRVKCPPQSAQTLEAAHVASH